MSSVDPYIMLGVSKTATQDEIKSAYRKKALKYHPDRNPDDPSAEELFKSVSTAYSIIGDEQSRREYDDSKRPRKPPSGFGDIFKGSNVDWGHHNNNSTWEDLFGSFKSGHNRPFAIKARVDITLEELVKGAQKTFVMDGSSMSFSIPRGARHGMTVVVPMRSNQELHATLNVVEHPFFTVTGDDLRCVIAVPINIAISGGEVSAQTLENNVKLKINKFTDSHKKLRVRNYGLFKPDGTRGSIIYELKLVFGAMSADELQRLEGCSS